MLEGNLNYTGAVITWLKDDLKLISSAKETEGLAREANPADRTYLVPAFTGLGAPYWDEKATASISGITRTTGKAEVIKSGTRLHRVPDHRPCPCDGAGYRHADRGTPCRRRPDTKRISDAVPERYYE